MTDKFFVGQLLYSTDNTTYSIKKIGRKYLTVKYHSGPATHYQDLRVVIETMMFEYTGYGNRGYTKLYTSEAERDIEIKMIRKRSIIDALIHSLPYRIEWDLLSEAEIDTFFSIMCKLSQIDKNLADKIESVYGVTGLRIRR